MSINLFAQKPGYYNNTVNLKGQELKTALHNIIKNHIDFSYTNSKFILEYAQEDPNNSKNLIQFYTNRSVPKGKGSWGTGGDKLNREHIWAASHGDFRGVRPMDGDAYNLHAADASVNVTRSNYDFDYVPNGEYISEADAKYKSSAKVFEPADRDKGAVARTLFYMAVRYEGIDGELDMQLIDKVKTAKLEGAKHGKLSTLLEWNSKYPPSDFERRRNERVSQSQRNRNAFIDYPNLANLIWGDAQLNKTVISNVEMTPRNPKSSDEVTITVQINNDNSAKLFWGKTYNSESYSVNFTKSDKVYQAQFSLNDFKDNELIYLKLKTSDNTEKHFSFYVAPNKTLTPISEVQGNGDSSPLNGKVVTISGIVTANFDNVFYMQSGRQTRSGICVFSKWRGHIGDSLTVTGTVKEYSKLTEITYVSMVYNHGKGEALKPIKLNIDDINEDYEGMFVSVEGVEFSNGGVKISEDTKSITLQKEGKTIKVYNNRNSRLIGQTLPTGTVNIQGVVSQYNNAYQLMLDNINWADLKNGTGTIENYVKGKVITYPNPIDNQLFVEAYGEIKSYTIFNVTGQIIKSQQNINNNKITIDCANLLTGSYLLRLNTSNGVVNKVIIKD